MMFSEYIKKRLLEIPSSKMYLRFFCEVKIRKDKSDPNDFIASGVFDDSFENFFGCEMCSSSRYCTNCGNVLFIEDEDENCECVYMKKKREKQPGVFEVGLHFLFQRNDKKSYIEWKEPFNTIKDFYMIDRQNVKNKIPIKCMINQKNTYLTTEQDKYIHKTMEEYKKDNKEAERRYYPLPECVLSFDIIVNVSDMIEIIS